MFYRILYVFKCSINCIFSRKVFCKNTLQWTERKRKEKQIHHAYLVERKKNEMEANGSKNTNFRDARLKNSENSRKEGRETE